MGEVAGAGFIWVGRMTRTQRFELPWPPSTNRLWRSVRGRNILSAEARRFKEEAGIALLMARLKMIKGLVVVWIVLHPPDRRRFEIDNRAKAILDAIKGVVIEDDWMVECLMIKRRGVVKGGKAVVTVMPVEEDPYA